MADSTIYGYNKGKVEGLSASIQSAYNACVVDILDTIKDEIVTPISTAWYAPEACGFFGKDEEGVVVPEENLKAVVKATEQEIYDCFDGFRQDIQAAGQNWYDNTSGQGETEGEGGGASGDEGGAVSLTAIEMKDMDLNVNAIQKQDDDGNVVLDDAGVSAVETNLATVEENIKAKMTAHKSELDASTSFIGGGQSAAIESCFERLLTAISDIFKWLSQGDESLQSAFTKARQKYANVAANITRIYNEADFTEEGEGGQQ